MRYNLLLWTNEKVTRRKTQSKKPVMREEEYVCGPWLSSQAPFSAMSQAVGGLHSHTLIFLCAWPKSVIFL
jgi:hypothetical protein